MNTLLILGQFLIALGFLYLVYRIMAKIFKWKAWTPKFKSRNTTYSTTSYRGIFRSLMEVPRTILRTITDMFGGIKLALGFRSQIVRRNDRNLYRGALREVQRRNVPGRRPVPPQRRATENTRASLVNNISKITENYSDKEKTKIHEMIRKDFNGSNYQEMNDTLRDTYPKAF